MTARTGTVVAFLARVRKDAVVPTVAQPSFAKSEPAFAGSVDEYISASSPDTTSRVQSMLRNRVKKCEVCGKPNGFTLSTCNQCGHSLTKTVISHTPNVFMGFVLGIGKAPFPLSISIRSQDEHTIVFDDLLALSSLHLNVIPTSHFIPDWRYLLRRPREGLALIDSMLLKCQTVAQEQFLGDESEWKRVMLRTPAAQSSSSSPPPETDVLPFSVKEHMCCGFNYPPSQSQLHLQYICPAVMPFQYAQFLNGVHFTAGRFFPFSYVRRCLSILVDLEEKKGSSPAVSIPPDLLGDDTDVAAIVQYFTDAHRHDYTAAHALYCKRFGELAEMFSNWNPDWFEGKVVPTENGQGVLLKARNETEMETVAVSEVAASDKARLQSYGRPYDAVTGRPSGSYYAHPKQPTDITIW